MKKITLCGSIRFKKEYEAINRQLSLEGNVVYTVAFFTQAGDTPLTVEQKELLDKIHKLKIDNSDGIFVIDVDGYIGESTRSEIEHAENTGKFVKYLSDFPDLKWITDSTIFSKPANLYSEEQSNKIIEIIRNSPNVDKCVVRVEEYLEFTATEINSNWGNTVVCDHCGELNCEDDTRL